MRKGGGWGDNGMQEEGLATGADTNTTNMMFIPKNVFHSRHSPVTPVSAFLFPLQLSQQLLETPGGPRP